MSRLSGRLRRAAGAVALLAAAAFVALAAAEMALRLLRPQTLQHDPDAFDPGPVLGGRLKPGFSDVFTSPEYATRWEINAAGYRGRAAGPKREGVVRIVAAGDSFTFGYGVEAEEAYAGKLEAMFRDRAPSGHEVFNLGVGGYGAVQEVAWLREKIAGGLAPDIVILGFYFGNDLSDSLRGAAAPGSRPGGVPPPASRAERWKRYLGSHFHLYALVSDRADGLLVRLGLRNVVYPEEVDVLRTSEPESVRAGWDAVSAALKDLHALAASAGFRTVVMAIPMRHQVVPASWERVRSFYERLTGTPLAGVDLDHPRRRLEKICAGAGLDLLDLTGTFRAAPDPARLYFKRDQHWTRDGHALAAETLARWIEGLP